MKEAWEIALDIKSECGDRGSRLRAVRDQLQSRIDKIQESIDECDWLTSKVGRLQKRTADLEWIDSEREDFLYNANNPDGLVSPVHMFTAMADLCTAILKDRTASCTN